MIIYRITSVAYKDMTGEGARLHGGRWNEKGIRAVYASQSISLAMLELLVRDANFFRHGRYYNFSIIHIEIEDKNVFTPEDLPQNWRSIPASPQAAIFGSKLLSEGVLCFKVPSVIVKSEHNFVINPTSKDFDKKVKIIKTEKIDIDERFTR